MSHFHLISSSSSLPKFNNPKRVYADFETSSGDPKKDSLNPWFNCKITGLAITVDDEPDAWYVSSEVMYGAGKQWFFDLLHACEDWTNHNVKYDAHVATNNLGDIVTCTLRDTIVLAKIVDSDRTFRGGYGLDALSKSWLKEDISKYEDAMKPYLNRNKDYGQVPFDIIGRYACQDVWTNRKLDKYISQHMHEDCYGVRDIEIELTGVLYRMERNGLRIDSQELKFEEFRCLKTCIDIDTKLETIVGFSFRPHVNADCFDVLCNHYGLPVLGWTEDGNPSFDKDALKKYLTHPLAPKEVIELIQEYRDNNTFLTHFAKPYQSLNTNGFLHPTYNQVLRTGRMSARQPSSQVLNKRAKLLIHPRQDYGFISCDYSQIEFRTIVHYIKDEAAIAAYNENPNTDFHIWVSRICGTQRRPAKTINFSIGFGQGRKATVAALSLDPDIAASIKAEVDALNLDEKSLLVMYHMLAQRKGREVYDLYHNTFPGIRITAKQAELAVRKRGYIRNAYGRHRHIPRDKAHIAFNTLNQSTAADIMKERTVALEKAMRNDPLLLVAQVHDELLMEAPIEWIDDRKNISRIVEIMEAPSFEFRVPIRVAVGTSKITWAAAAESAEAWVES